VAVIDQRITDRYAVYNGDSAEVLPTLPADSAHLSVYSPPFAELYLYSSSERDLSNCRDYEEFLAHYEFIVRQVHRLTRPGRVSCVHCADIPIPGQRKGYRDLPGDIIKMHERVGWYYHGRVCIWKEPLRVALRTRLQHLTHKNICKDSSVCFPAGADFLLLFKKHGKNEVPVAKPTGLDTYAGEKPPPERLLKHRGETRQEKNRLSQWIWRRYASAFWTDVRVERVLPYKQCREPDDEKHVCPLQLDVIERAVVLWSNPGEVVLTPFMGVGSEVYEAVRNGRKGVGVELKPAYFKQTLKNLDAVDDAKTDAGSLLSVIDAPAEKPAKPKARKKREAAQ
jgi:DNA modification methylase